jgi:hypothetical protein
MPNTVRSPFVSIFNLSRINAKKQRCSWRASSRLGQEIPRHFKYLKIYYRASAAQKKQKLCTMLRNVLIFIHD